MSVKKRNNLSSQIKHMALNKDSAYRTKKVTIPEWENLEVTIREPSGAAWIKFREALNVEENTILTPLDEFIRNKNAEVELFIDVLLDEEGGRVFTDDDKDVVAEIYGPVHSRILTQAMNLSLTQEEAKEK